MSLLQYILGKIFTRMYSISFITFIKTGIVVDKEFARNSLSLFEGGPDFDVLRELKQVWGELARQQLGQLPLKVEFHTRPDVTLRKGETFLTTKFNFYHTCHIIFFYRLDGSTFDSILQELMAVI
jgi:hypothetical protein